MITILCLILAVEAIGTTGVLCIQILSWNQRKHYECSLFVLEMNWKVALEDARVWRVRFEEAIAEKENAR